MKWALAKKWDKKRREEGQSMVELALTLPILVLILCAVLDFGWIFANCYGVQQAAYAGARCASLNASSYSTAQLQSLVTTRVGENLWQDPSQATVTLAMTSDQARVTVEYPVKMLTFVGTLCFGTTYEANATSVAMC